MFLDYCSSIYNNCYRGIQVLKQTAADFCENSADLLCENFNSVRKKLKHYIKNSSLNISLEEYQNQRAHETLANAKNRNYAKTNTQIAQYHQSIKYSSDNKQGIFLEHQAPVAKDKKQIILLMGNLQNPGMSEHESGILKIFNKLKKENKHDLLLVRVGSAKEDLLHKLGFSDNANLNTDVVYEHISNLIEDRIKQRGVFSSYDAVTQIDSIAYSWGGGVQKKLEERWSKIVGREIPTRTFGIDRINYGCESCGEELCFRPNYSKEDIEIYQNNEFLINGEQNQDCKKHDQFIDINTIQRQQANHCEIDDCQSVIERAMNFINCDPRN